MKMSSGIEINHLLQNIFGVPKVTTNNRLTVYIVLILVGLFSTAVHARNLLKNSGFETGLERWAVPTWRTDMLTPQVESAIIHGPGQGSIRIVGEKGRYGNVYQDITPRAGVKSYNASAWVSISRLERWWEVGIFAEFIGEDNKWLGMSTFATLGQDVSGDLDWKKIEGNCTIPDGTKVVRFELLVRAPMPNNEPANLGTVWFDDVTMEESGTPDAPPLPEITINKFTPLGTDGFFLPGSKPELLISLTNDSSQPKDLNLDIVVKDFNNNTVYKGTQTVKVSADSELKQTITIPRQAKQGFYGVTASVKDDKTTLASGTSSFCVVVPAPKGNSFLGMTTFDQGNLETMRLMGTGRYAFWISWRHAEAQQGVFDFTEMDNILNPWLKTGYKAIGYIDTRFTPGLTYITPDWMEKFVLDWHKTNTGAYPPEYYTAWGKYIGEVVNHYKDRVNMWTLYQEIDLTTDQPGGVEHYIKLIKTASEAAKQADPTCVLGGISVSGCDGQAGFPIARKLWPILSDSLDGFFWDCYIDPKEFGPGYEPIGEERGGLRQVLLAARDIIKPFGKNRLGIDEKGCKIVTTLPVDSPYAKDMAKVIARGFVVAKSVPELDHYMYFLTNSAGCIEGDADYGLWKNNSPRPSVAAYATSARMLLDTSEPVEVNLHKDVFVYVFKKGKGSLAVLWTVLKNPVPVAFRLPASADIYDLMGNKTASISKGKHEFSLTDSPIFLLSSASPKATAAALRNSRFSLPLVKSDAKIASSKSVNIYVANQSGKTLKASVETAQFGDVKWVKNVKTIGIAPRQVSTANFASKVILRTGTLHSKVTIDGLTSKLDKELSFYTVPKLKGLLPESIFFLKPMVFDGPNYIFPSGGDAMSNKLWTGPADLSIRLWLVWDVNNLYVTASVTDDAFIQEQSAMEMWAGDGFQLSFDTLNDGISSELTGVIGYGSDDYEYGIAQTVDGPQSYCWVASSTNKAFERTVLKNSPIIKQPDDHTTTYQWAIPWCDIAPLKPTAGKPFGFNFSYADIDKPGESVRYWMGMTTGICSGKDPSVFKTFILEE